MYNYSINSKERDSNLLYSRQNLCEIWNMKMALNGIIAIYQKKGHATTKLIY